MTSVQFQIGPTPNPNSIRIALSSALFPKALSFASAAQAQADPLAAKLFAIAGVTQVFMLNNFLSVNKDAGADWAAVEPRIAQVLQGHFNG